MITRILFLVTIVMSATSCATIMNQSHKQLTIYTTEPSTIVYRQDTIATAGNKARLTVKRNKEPLTILAYTDSTTKTVQVQAYNSFMYYYNIFSNYGFGMLVDRNKPKRYSYPQAIYINSADTLNRYFRHGQANQKGELRLHISLPHINSFRLKPENEGTKINTGFWGVIVGVDYFHSKNQFVSINASSVADFFVPVPAAVDISGEYEMMSSRYTSISNNHKLKRFFLGYGLSYAKNTWDFRYYDRFDPAPPTREPVKKSNNAFGLIFPAYFQAGEVFNVGVVYRPTFYRPKTTNKFQYEHLISFDFAWKIRLKS